MPVSEEPLDCLVEIAAIGWARMHNTAEPPGPHESYTLGLIMGTAMRNPIVSAQLSALEQAVALVKPIGNIDLGDDPDGDIEGYDGG